MTLKVKALLGIFGFEDIVAFPRVVGSPARVVINMDHESLLSYVKLEEAVCWLCTGTALRSSTSV